MDLRRLRGVVFSAMKALTVVVGLAVTIPACDSRSQTRAAEQEKQIQELTAKLAVKTTGDTLGVQERCATQARAVFQQLGWAKDPTASYANHYNAKMDKCFMVVESTDAKLNPGTFWISKTLSDAFEGKEFGTYIWHSDKVKKYWDVPPVMCSVVLTSGENGLCTSDDEYQTLVKTYME